MWYSLLLLGYKPVQHVTVLNTVGNCNTVVSIVILKYNIMGPPSHMRSVVDRNVVMRRIPVIKSTMPRLCALRNTCLRHFLSHQLNKILLVSQQKAARCDVPFPNTLCPAVAITTFKHRYVCVLPYCYCTYQWVEYKTGNVRVM
jgi:hypothetical protein